MSQEHIASGLVMERDLPRLHKSESVSGIVPAITLTGLQSARSTPRIEVSCSPLEEDLQNFESVCATDRTYNVDRVRRRGDILSGQDSRPGVTYRVIPDSAKSYCIPEEDDIEMIVLYPDEKEIANVRRGRSYDGLPEQQSVKSSERRFVSTNNSSAKSSARSKFSQFSERMRNDNGSCRRCRSSSSRVEVGRSLFKKEPSLTYRMTHRSKRSAVRPIFDEDRGRGRHSLVAFNSPDMGGDGYALWAHTKSLVADAECEVETDKRWNESEDHRITRSCRAETRRPDNRCGGDQVYKNMFTDYADYENPDLILPYEENKLDFAISEPEEPTKCFCFRVMCKVILYLLYKSSSQRRSKKNL